MNNTFFWYLITNIKKKKLWLRNLRSLGEICGLVFHDNEIAKIDPELLNVLQQKKNIPLAIYFTNKENQEQSYPACFQTRIYSASLAQKKLKKTDLAKFSFSLDNSDKTEARDLLKQLSGYFLYKGSFPKNQVALEFDNLPVITSNYLKTFINLGFQNIILQLNDENIRLAEAWCSDLRAIQYSNKKVNKDLVGVWRAQIDALDQILINVLKQRLQIVDEMGKVKQKNNQAFFDAERWHEILSSRKKIAKNAGLDEHLVEEIFGAIHLDNLRHMLGESD